MTHQPSYQLLEDVPPWVSRASAKSGRVIVFRTPDGRWRNQAGQIVPLDAGGPWTAEASR